MASVSDVVTRTANELGLLRLGQSLQAQDNTRITSAYDEVYAILKKDGLAVWASDGTIPAEIVPHLVTLMANTCLQTYGVSNDRYTRIKNESGSNDGDKAKRAIQKLVAPDYPSMDEPTDY